MRTVTQAHHEISQSDAVVSSNVSLAIGAGVFHILAASDAERNAAAQEKSDCNHYFSNKVIFLGEI